ncbi:DUF4865 family protein [Sodalis ligni]|uniref:DUF4865 family protein n=1 Tax=Sodalis ligni TaxID=2697027 RepID=UPI00193EF27C|nr:DUF4865 family protein [Sodalis ligni]QWA11126.1 DUF4865 family protein [Sodalis ligni]
MIAMQYRFTLPADYDMSIIEQRIHDNGARLDNYPGLVFKTYLYARRGGVSPDGKENRYAPLYVWRDGTAMTGFLQSDAFEKLIRDFGWPVIECWTVISSPDLTAIDGCLFATISTHIITPYTTLTEALQPGGGNELTAWDCSRWSVLRARFSSRPEEPGFPDRYRIGYIAGPRAV